MDWKASDLKHKKTYLHNAILTSLLGGAVITILVGIFALANGASLSTNWRALAAIYTIATILHGCQRMISYFAFTRRTIEQMPKLSLIGGWEYCRIIRKFLTGNVLLVCLGDDKFELYEGIDWVKIEKIKPIRIARKEIVVDTSKDQKKIRIGKKYYQLEGVPKYL